MATRTNQRLRGQLRSVRQIVRASRGFTTKPSPRHMQTKTLRRLMSRRLITDLPRLTPTEAIGELRHRRKRQRQSRRLGRPL